MTETNTIPKAVSQTDVTAYRDEGTKLPNLAYFLHRLRVELERAKIKGEFCSLILFEVDNMKEVPGCSKSINGNEALSLITPLLGGQITSLQELERKKDIFCRIGSEKVGVILPGMSLKGAILTAERLRQTFKNQSISGGVKNNCLTASFGVVCYPEIGNTLENLLERAEIVLSLAKKNGKNRVEVYQPEN